MNAQINKRRRVETCAHTHLSFRAESRHGNDRTLEVGQLATDLFHAQYKTAAFLGPLLQTMMQLNRDTHTQSAHSNHKLDSRTRLMHSTHELNSRTRLVHSTCMLDSHAQLMHLNHMFSSYLTTHVLYTCLTHTLNSHT